MYNIRELEAYFVDFLAFEGVSGVNIPKLGRLSAFLPSRLFYRRPKINRNSESIWPWAAITAATTANTADHLAQRNCEPSKAALTRAESALSCAAFALSRAMDRAFSSRAERGFSQFCCQSIFLGQPSGDGRHSPASRVCQDSIHMLRQLAAYSIWSVPFKVGN